MNAENALKLARRFIELPQEKRRLFLDGLREEGVDFSLLPIPAGVPAADRDGLSYAQRRMWFLWQLDPQGAAYNLPMAVRLKGRLDRVALQGAFDALVARHESLRCHFVQDGDVVCQQVLELASVAIGVEDLIGLSPSEQEERVAVLAEVEAQAPFDLAVGPLLRIRLLKLAEHEHVLLLTLHHIVADGWSLNLLIEEFLSRYDAACDGLAAELPPLPIQYRDYALWQRSWLEAGERERQLAYWRDKLGDDHTPLELPVDHSRPLQPSHRGARHAFRIDTILAERLRTLARQHNATLFMVLLAAFKLLLQRYSGQTAIRVGVPIANRHRAEVEGLIGCFINTQVLHTEIDPLIGVAELLRRVRETALGAQAHQDLPFEQLVEALDLHRGAGQSPLFQVLFNHQSNVADVGKLQTRSGLALERVESARHTARFDLALDTYESAGQLHAAFTYALDVFDAATIARLEEHWLCLLEGLVEEGVPVVGELPLSQALDTAGKPVYHSLDEGDCIHQLFERVVSRYPERTAAVSGNDSISYARLSERADELAQVLRGAGVLPDQRVGVVGDRSIDMLVGILGTLKAGAAYLPLEPEQPQERLEFMLADSGVSLVLARSSWSGTLPTGVRMIGLDESLPPVTRRAETPVLMSPGNLAYVIYTSGTTGVPKGVAVSHGALVNYIEGIARRLPLEAIDIMAMVSTPAADLGHTVLYGALCMGKTLHLLDKEMVLDAEAFGAYMDAHKVDALKIVPSHLDAMLSAGRSALPGRCLILGGEACPPALLARIASMAPDVTVLNHYGPTETTVGVLAGELQKLTVLGKPLENTGAQVLDACLQIVPGSARGELYISGAGLARGYLERPALTAERFVPDPADTHGGRMYRTGDWVRRNGEGELLFVGRMDGQVKIRGYRVELAEIESRLRSLPGVGNALLRVIGEEHARQLVAYLVPAKALGDQAEQAFLDEVRSALKRALPEHMVPAHLLVLEHLPVTANGKVDLKVLPEPVASSAAYVAPATLLQTQLADIWAEVLRVERVGLSDNFFSLGGDSIMTIQVVTRARRMGIQLSPRDLFQHQTIRELAAIAQREIELFIDQGPVAGETPLTPIQSRFLEMEIPERHHWNQSVLLKPTRNLDAQVLEHSLRALITHHDALRLSFRQDASRGWAARYRSLAEQQQIWDEERLVWHVALGGPDELQFVMDKAQRSLDLDRGPLLRAVLADLPNADQRLLVVIHHLVVDGVSWRVLLEDLQEAYEAALAGRNIELPAKTSSFKAWAESLSGLVSGKALNQDLGYWKQQLVGLDDTLPVDHPEGGCQQKHAAYVSTHLDRHQTRRLLKEAPLAYRTQVNDLLLAALARLICRWSGRAEILVRLEGHGREDLFDDVDTTRTVGWFTSVFPARLKPLGTLAGSVKAIKEQLRAIPNKGMGYGLLRYLSSPDIRQVFEQLPQGEIVFNYLGQFDQSFATKDALFKHSGAHSGSAHCEDGPLGSLLSINGHVYDEELELTWTYSREKFDESTIQHLADAYARELEELIEHCCDGRSCAVTPSDFPLAKLSQEQLDNLPIPASEIIDVYPLSPMQQGMLFHTLYNQNGGEYINQMRVDVEGLDVERFRQAWQSTLDAHEVLRSIFVWQGDLERPVQVVRRQVELPFAEYDWRSQPYSQEALGTLAEGERRQGFDLTYAPLLRLAVVRVTEDTYHLIYTSHHVLMDGWSSSRLFGEVLQRYSGRAVTPCIGRYRDYIYWLEQRDPAASESFWRGQLAELEEPTRLVQVVRREPCGEQGYGDHLQVFDVEQTGRLKHFARRHKVTVNTLVQAAWLLLLQRYTGQETVCLGATVAGRPTELVGAEEQIGLFINTLPVIASPRPEQSVAEWIQQVQARNLALMAFEDTPLYEVQRWAELGGDALFDNLLVFENYPVSEALQQGGALSGLHFGEVENHEQTNYPLTLAVGLGETLSIQYSHDRARLGGEVVQQIAGHFGNLLEAMIGDAKAVLGELSLLSPQEHQRITHDWNRTEASYPSDQCIHQLIEAQVERTPEATALIFGEQELSYGELNRRANSLAHKLREFGVGPDVLVGIVVERSLEMVVGLLAILKAGGAYVPLDPEYPQERLAYMMEDSQALLLLSQSTLLERLPQDIHSNVQLLDKLELGSYPIENLAILLSPDNLAYSIYTSGSTGRPKGVLIEHRNVVALISWAHSVYSQEDLMGVLASTSICFDLSVWELFVTLSAGGYVVLANNALELPQLVAKDRVRLINTVPSAIKALHESGQVPGNVRIVNLAGEALKQSLVDSLYQSDHIEKVYDLYGPSEDTTYSTYTLRRLNGQSNIGGPISNSSAHLLSAAMTPLPVGCAGEVYLAGAGLVRGYLGRPALTAEKFLPNPFNDSEQGGERLYRTGDLARYRSDGVIEYVGRIDHQVKIRGFRIELGEIEARLQGHAAIREAVVVDIEGPSGKQLAAYLVTDIEPEQQAVLRTSLRDHLKEALPDYMVPAHLIFLETMPLTPNGKLDRKALPKPDASQLQQEYVAPQSELEQQIAAIWADVLKVERVGLTDNFFELGGHSLLATQVTSRIRQALQIDLPLRILFEAPVLADFAAHTGQGAASAVLAFERVDRNQPLALSYAQQRQWFLWQLEPESSAYNMPAALRLKGELDIEALRSSFDALIARHETLRTTFRQDGEQAVQVIHPRIDLVWGQEALEAADEELIQSKVEEEIAKPFDLEQGPLLRVKLLRLAESDHVLILTLHHIVSDGWSMPIMVDELVRLYEGYCTGQETSLPELPIQYADYAIWQRQWMEAGEQERQLAYWKAQLGEEQPVLELPTDHPRPAIQSQKGAGLSIELSDALAQSLKQLAQQQGVTLFMLLLASFQTLLHRYSGQDDIRVGVPIANRNRVETERLIGFFVNTQVLKAEFDLQMTFSELLKQVQQTALAAQAHQDLPFEQLVEALHPERSLSHSPLFQVMYNHQSQVRGESRHLPGLEVEGLILEGHTAKFDLTLDTFEHEQGIGASLSYATALFDKPSIERMAGHWLNLLESIVEAPQQRIAELPLLGEEEYRQVVYDWNRTEASYPSEQCVHQLIEVQAEKTPDAVAVVFGDQELTYQQLNRRSNQLAHKLRELGIGPDVLVGIAVERSLDMVIGLLAILKAGGAYVPLDPEYPQERLAYMMEDSGIRLLLTQVHLQDQLPIPGHVQSLSLDSGKDWLKDCSEANPINVTHPENLAYVMYTSGSTGRPKGVAISHKKLSVFCAVACEYSRLSCADRVLQFATVSFDGFVEQFYPALCVGAQVILRDTQLWDGATLYANIRRYGITLADLPAAYWRMMAMDDASEVHCDSLRQVHVGGEALPLDGLKAWLESEMAGVRLLNTYGPTEASVVATVYDCSPISLDCLPVTGVPIGHVLPGRAVHIVDNGFSPTPAGVVGELFIGGTGCLARSYFKRPSLTAERFIPDPFDSSTQGGGRLYRTGDLARYRSDGVIEYVGRIDHQVKIRGFRIELGEIEARLQGHAAVREAVVVDIEGPSGKQLAAYLVTDIEPEQQAILRTSLRDHLKEALPDYMVPAHLIFLETMPLTPNGKLDRKALPKPDASQLQQEYVAPQSELEQQIAAIWADVLKVERVGLTDNFFELGGHSLLATQVTSRIRQALQIDLPLRILFEAPVLADFAAHTGQGAASAVLAFERVDRNQPLALSYAQQRQWFLWQLEPESAAYNMPAALRLRGELDIEALRSSFDALIARHETLRTTFRQDGEQAVQVIHPRIDLVWGQEALEAADEELIQSKVEEEIAKPFDLEQGPLLRVKLLRLAESDHVLILTLHHIVSDGWSMPIMVDELVRLYEGYCTGQETSLPELPIQYADYAIWQRQWMEAGEQERQLAYWKAQLGEEQPVLELPTDHPRPAIQSQKGAGLSIELSDALAQSLKQLAQQQGVTLFMLLLASFQTLLHRYSGQDDIRVGVPIANRNRVETERLIGFFVNTQVLKAEFDLQMTFSELLKQVQQTALAAQAHQDLPFEQLVEALHPERSLSHSPLFQVMYNHQSQVRGESRHLPGLEVEGLILEGHTAKFDLTLDTFEHEQGIGASLSYATALFDKSSIERMAGHWLNLLEGIVEAPQQRIAELPMLAEAESRAILEQWDNAHANYPSGRYIHQLIEDQARLAPEAVAVLFNDQQLSYRQLDAQANRLAHKLIELGVGPEMRVAIAMRRSAEIVVAFLAVLKAGGAYVPLDVAYPQERLLYMMEDCAAALVLTQSDLLDVLAIPQGLVTVLVDQDDVWDEYLDSAPDVAIAEDNLAYVIYTSGSTGQPKGVAVSHGPLVAHIQALGELYETGPADCELHFMSFAFDGSHEGWMHPLINGARVLIRDDSLWLPEHTLAQMHRHGVTMSVFPPIYLQQLAEHAAREGNPPPTRVYCFGGDAVPQASYELAWNALRPQYIFNGYGPTETVVTPLLWTASKGDPCGAAYAPIGTLVGRRRGYILGGNLSLLPVGFAGELYLGGNGVARGYLDRPGLTAERFVPDPFGDGERVYRSGDLTRARADGVVDYLGRVDYQVKIRGFRIELGEIEARLQGHAAVHEAVVVDIEGPSGKQLVAYLVTDIEPEQQAILRTSLRDHLKEALPDYMVPAHLIFLETMPLTPNGKLDRKALPKPDASQLQQEYVAPQSELEQQIAAIWADVLKVERVGLTDNFFELGGHSLLATQVIVHIRDLIGVDISLRELFELPQLIDFTKRLEKKSNQMEPLQAELTKSLEALKRLSSEEIDELTS